MINPFGAISEGRDEMERMLAPMFAGVGKGSIHASETIGVHFVTDDLAVVDGEAVIGGFRNADGSPMPPLRHRFTDVFVYAHQARPGVILSQEFLAPLGISQVAFAAHLGVPVQRINGRINGKRGITPETAWLLAAALDTTPEFWINLQTAYELARSRPTEPVQSLAAVS